MNRDDYLINRMETSISDSVKFQKLWVAENKDNILTTTAATTDAWNPYFQKPCSIPSTESPFPLDSMHTHLDKVTTTKKIEFSKSSYNI